MIYLNLFIGFLKVGLFTFGGGYAAIPLIRDIVLSYGWLSSEKLSYMIAVSESTPGPVMVNLATYVGSSQGGILGAAIATFCVIFPAFIIILLIMVVFKKLLSSKCFSTVLTGLKSSVLGIILSVGAFMIIENVIHSVASPQFDFLAIVLTVLLAAIMFVPKFFGKKINSIAFIGISAVLGIIAYGI